MNYIIETKKEKYNEMSYGATVYNVMMASPSDVSAERAIIQKILYEWNTINSFSRNIVLLPVGWESHSSPEAGDTPQSILNKQVLEKSDILIGVFWTRLGTPTTEYQSGTVEEIEKHILSGKLTMLYFSSRPVELDSVDQNQYNELKRFKDSCKTRSLYEGYDDLNDFKDKFYRHLQLKINEHEMFKSNNSTTPNEIYNSHVSIPVLSEEAKTLLKGISADPNGQLICAQYLRGTSIISNSTQFCNTQVPREIARWKEAISDLLKMNLIARTGKKDEIYTITDLGYKVADTIEIPIV